MATFQAQTQTNPDDNKSAAEAAAPAAPPETPEALVKFMLEGWAERRAPFEPLADAEAFAARRRALSRLFPGELLIIPTGGEKVRANDTHFRFRPSSDFYYLTGNLEPDCVLALVPDDDGGHRDVLFVEPVTRGDATFFTDRSKGELWVGARLGVEPSRERYRTHECRSLRDLKSFIESVKSAHPARVLRGFDADIDLQLPPTVDSDNGDKNDNAGKEKKDRDRELAVALSELRLCKDAVEIRELSAAIASTRRGFEDVIRALPRSPTERWVEGVFFLRARTEGNDVGYGTIAAAGSHACILHWTHNDGAIRPGELLLLDAGVEARSLYTADITRTLPIDGRFTPEQRIIYDLVHRAQAAGIAAVRPGVDFMEPNRVCMRVLAEGLRDLDILKVPVEESLREDRLLHRRWTLHNVSHMLGLDVHDCAQARKENYKYGKLKPGMVLTVEPGLYFQPDDLTVPERFRGIGVRIEDDILVTETGYRNLSADIPSAADEVERWIAGLWATAPR